MLCICTDMREGASEDDTRIVKGFTSNIKIRWAWARHSRLALVCHRLGDGEERDASEAQECQDHAHVLHGHDAR